MGYQPQPRKKSPKGSIHNYKRSFHEKSKTAKHSRKRVGTVQEKRVMTQKEVAELTLKRLHVLGKQRFGSFPFSEHFDRWLGDVELVLSEFQSDPNIGVDDQFVKECSETLASIKRQLEEIHSKEAAVNQEIKNLNESKSSLARVDNEYLTKTREVRAEKNRELKRLYSNVETLRKEEERVMRLKAGFFRGISKKEKEQKETELAQEISDKERQAELAMLDLKAAQKRLREEYEAKREPFLEKQKSYRKKIENLEEDGSLEERWFACEALTDAVNSFLQRKAAQPDKNQEDNA